jgi:hypothetical protein
VEKPEAITLTRTEYLPGVVIKYQNITIEKPVPYIPEEINQTIESLNKSLEEKENLILNLTIESLNKNLEIKNLTNEITILLISFYLLIAMMISLLIYIFDLNLRIKKMKKGEKK